MKYFLIASLIFLFSGRSEPIDHANYKATYKVLDVNRTTPYFITTLIGDNIQYTFDENKQATDSIFRLNLSMAETKAELSALGKITYEVKTLLNTEDGTVKVFDAPIPTALYYKEHISHKWIVNSEKKLIGTYSCQKATMNYAGRKYIAWFAVNIPLNNGPYKFYSLPGLIVSVYDEDKKFVYELQSLYKLETPRPINLYMRQPTEKSFSYIRKLYIQSYEDPWNFFRQQKPELTFSDPALAKALMEQNKPKNYEFMELLPN